MTALPRERRTTALCLSITAFAIGQGVLVSNGNLHPDSIAWLTVGLVAALLGTVVKFPDIFEFGVERVLLVLLAFALGYQFLQLVKTLPGIYLRIGSLAEITPFYAGLAGSALLCGMGFARRPVLGKVLPLLVVASFVSLGAWMIKASPNPFIDVFVFQRDGAAELLAGKNPYALQYPDIYGNSPFYGEGVSVNGKLNFGFPYLPLSLLLSLPGHVWFGDYRYAQVAASGLAALLLMYTRPSPIARALAALYLFHPRAFFVIEQGWTDPFVVMGLSAVVFAATRFPRATPWVFGFFLAIKQYLIFALPAGFLLLPRPVTRREALVFFGKASLVVAAITVPFFLWDPKAFWWDVVQLQTVQPFRTEALSYLAWWVSQGHERPSTALAFITATAAVAYGLWRMPRTPSGFASCVTLAYLCFFAFNKQAFCNYYAFVIGAAAIAAGAMSSEADDDARTA